MSGFFLISLILLMGVYSGNPGPRKNSAIASHQDKIFLFGGISDNKYFCDLWVYHITSKQWQLLQDYSCPLLFDDEQTNALAPSSRSGHSFINLDGFIYLYGGYRNNVGSGNEYLLDFWAFNANHREEEWIDLKNGPVTNDVINVMGVYFGEDIFPGSREQHAMVENNGFLYMFGGEGYSSMYPPNFNGYLCDLWKYDPVEEKWNFLNDGCQGEYFNKDDDYLKWPGSRKSHSLASYDNFLILFGGIGRQLSYPTSNEYLCDIWKYNITGEFRNRWYFVNTGCGGDYASEQTDYGYPYPGSRIQHEMLYFQNQLFLFGGIGFGSNSSTPGYLSDIFTLDPTNGDWQFFNAPLGVTELLNQLPEYNYTNPSVEVFPGGRVFKQTITISNFGSEIYAIGNDSPTGFLCDIFKFDGAQWEIIDECPQKEIDYCNIGFGYWWDYTTYPSEECTECEPRCKVCDDPQTCLEYWCEDEFDFCQSYVTFDDVSFVGDMLQDHTNAIAVLQRDFGDFQLDFNELSNNFDGLQQDFNTHEQDFSSHVDSYDNYVSSHLILHGELDNMIQILEQTTNTAAILDIQDQINAITAKNDLQDGEISSLETAIQELTTIHMSDIQRIDDAISLIKVDINFLNGENDREKFRLNTVIDENLPALQNSIDGLAINHQNDVDSLNGKIDAHVISTVAHSNIISNIVSDVNALQTKNVEQDDEIAGLKVEANIMKDKHDTDLAAHINEFNGKISTLENDLKSQIGVIDIAVKDTVSVHEKEIDEFAAQQIAQNKEIVSLKEEIKELKEQHALELKQLDEKYHQLVLLEVNKTLNDKLEKLSHQVFHDAPRESLNNTIAASGITFGVLVLIILFLVIIFVIIIFFCVRNSNGEKKQQVVRERRTIIKEKPITAQELDTIVKEEPYHIKVHHQEPPQTKPKEIFDDDEEERKIIPKRSANVFVVNYLGQPTTLALRNSFFFNDRTFNYEEITEIKKGNGNQFSLEINEKEELMFETKDVNEGKLFQSRLIDKLREVM